ncbi:unnamed protein product [Oppiella nova]|uniref:Uncharacterized protein n=1 Tax=Oppiella nova TaxID=334625 RepID=A0A7R9QQW7_9ACAR|nr:unnamed protein product [Oppiella nova]CAG2171771.1 unnamed protein product [Oppiella nova]
MDILKYYGLVVIYNILYTQEMYIIFCTLRFAGSQESILNIDVDLDVNQHYWHHRGRHRNSSGDEIEVVHIPISSPMARSNRRRQHRSRGGTGSNSGANQSLQSQSPSSSSVADIVSDDGLTPNHPLTQQSKAVTTQEEVVVNIAVNNSDDNKSKSCAECHHNCANASTGSIGSGLHIAVDDSADFDDERDCRQPLSSTGVTEGMTVASGAATAPEVSHNTDSNTTDGSSCSYDRLCSDEKY